MIAPVPVHCFSITFFRFDDALPQACSRKNGGGGGTAINIAICGWSDISLKFPGWSLRDKYQLCWLRLNSLGDNFAVLNGIPLVVPFYSMGATY